MFRSVVLLGGKIWKHKHLRPNQSRKRSHNAKMERVAEVDAWLRKYNENPNNSLPKRPRNDWLSIYPELKEDSKFILKEVEKQAKNLKPQTPKVSKTTVPKTTQKTASATK